MKLRGIEVSKSVRCLLYRVGFAEVAWKALSVAGLIFSRIWHVGRDVYQPGNRWVHPGFSNYCSPITVSNQNAWSILQSEDALRRRHVFFERCLRLLDDADVITILD